jgi:hypothetical protein
MNFGRHPPHDEHETQSTRGHATSQLGSDPELVTASFGNSGIESGNELERETGIEPATSSLGSWRSTAELLPLEAGERS